MLDLERVDATLINQMKHWGIPGLSVALIQDCEIRHAASLGRYSGAVNLNVTDSTPFPLCSVSKTLTATLLMRLVEAGHLELDHPIKRYLDDLVLRKEKSAERVTLRQLLSHTSGLAGDFYECDVGALEQYVRKEISRLPVLSPPGRVVAYSNPGFNLAGFIASHVTQTPFARLLQEKVLEPLEMHHTTARMRDAMRKVVEAQGGSMDSTLPALFPYNNGMAPAGGIMGTAGDLANFAIMHMRQGVFKDQPYLRPETVAEMHRVQATTYAPGARPGLGFWLDRHRGLQVVSHDGGWKHYGAYFRMVPEAGVAVILLFNDPAGYRFDVGLLLDALLKVNGSSPPPEPEPELEPLPEVPMAHHTGLYVHPFGGLLEVTQDESGFLNVDLNGCSIPVRAKAMGHFTGEGPADTESLHVTFVPSDEEATQLAVVSGWRLAIEAKPFHRIERPPHYAPTPSEMGFFVGTYTAPRHMVDAEKLDVTLEGGHLWVHSQLLSLKVRCVPLGLDTFACDMGVIEFSRKGSSVVGLSIGGFYSFSKQ